MKFETGSRYYTTCSVLSNCFSDKGKVLLAKHKSSGSLVAIKHFNLEELNHEQYELTIGEISYMRQLQHPNIISCLTSYVINFDLYMVSPLMGFTSCYNLIKTYFQEGLPEILIAFFLQDVLRALNYIHDKGYIHRAVKARHILVRADGHVCLSGLRYMYNKVSKRGEKVFDFPLHASRNLNWLSPELLEQSSEGYNEKSDVYSVGVTACELANGIVPFAETSSTLMLTEKVRGVIPQLIDCTTWFLYEDGQIIEKDINCGDELNCNEVLRCNEFVNENDQPTRKITRKFTDAFHIFVEMCSHRNVSIRPLPKHLLNHSFFKPLRHLSGWDVQELLQTAIPYTESNTAELVDDVVANDLSDNFNYFCINSKEWDF